jgi:MFS family permease
MDKSRPTDLKGLKLIYRALYHRNYRLFFRRQSVSMIGTWMQLIAVNWLTFRLTHSPFLLGVVGFTSRIPTFVLAPFAGVLVDRWDRHRILLVTQILSMVQALIFAALVLTDRIAVWHIISLSLLLGVINTLDMPARQSFVIDMVEKKEDLGNAIALNSSMGTGARLIGPAIAGILIAAFGEGICFLLNGLSFIAVIMSLLEMIITAKESKKQSTSVMQGLKEGFDYTFGFPPIRSILLLLALVSLMAMPYMVLMPVFAKDIFHSGAHAYGFLVTASGCGALAAAIFLASRKSVLGLERIIVIGSSLFGTALIIFSLSRVFWLSLLLMVLVGFGMMMSITPSNTALQTIVEDDKRGRVMSFYAMAFFGMVPFGSLFAGSLAHMIGAPATLIIGGIICIFGSVLFACNLSSFRKLVRPIYVKKGILSEEQTEQK